LENKIVKRNFVISLLACGVVITYIMNQKKKNESNTQYFINKATMLSDDLERKILEKQYENNTINNNI